MKQFRIHRRYNITIAWIYRRSNRQVTKKAREKKRIYNLLVLEKIINFIKIRNLKYSIFFEDIQIPFPSLKEIFEEKKIQSTINPNP